MPESCPPIVGRRSPYPNPSTNNNGTKMETLSRRAFLKLLTIALVSHSWLDEDFLLAGGVTGPRRFYLTRSESGVCGLTQESVTGALVFRRGPDGTLGLVARSRDGAEALTG